MVRTFELLDLLFSTGNVHLCSLPFVVDGLKLCSVLPEGILIIIMTPSSALNISLNFSEAIKW